MNCQISLLLNSPIHDPQYEMNQIMSTCFPFNKDLCTANGVTTRVIKSEDLFHIGSQHPNCMPEIKCNINFTCQKWRQSDAVEKYIRNQKSIIRKIYGIPKDRKTLFLLPVKGDLFEVTTSKLMGRRHRRKIQDDKSSGWIPLWKVTRLHLQLEVHTDSQNHSSLHPHTQSPPPPPTNPITLPLHLQWC